MNNMSNPITLNKYLYGSGNPVMYSDPSGNVGICGMMATIAVAGILATLPTPVYAIEPEKRVQMIYYLYNLNTIFVDMVRYKREKKVKAKITKLNKNISVKFISSPDFPSEGNNSRAFVFPQELKLQMQKSPYNFVVAHGSSQKGAIYSVSPVASDYYGKTEVTHSELNLWSTKATGLYACFSGATLKSKYSKLNTFVDKYTVNI